MTGSYAKRVLVVEDDPRLGPLLVELLETEWTVSLVSSGDQALALPVQHGFNVLIVDRGLPGIDGIALIQELRRRPDPTPVLGSVR